MVIEFRGGLDDPKKPPSGLEADQNKVVDFSSFLENRKKKEQPIAKGSEFTIPNLGEAPNFGYETELPWVDIVRGETGHGTKDRGIIKHGKTISVMGASKEFGVLCRYNNKESKRGTECENGTLFFIDPIEILFWLELVNLQKQKETRRHKEVERILAEFNK